MKLFAINTGNLKLDGGAMFGVVPKVIWNGLYPSDNENLINLSMRCLLIVTENKKIIIDVGIGNKQDQKFFNYYCLNGDATLYSSLAEVGFSPENITDVILTHLHFDHAGGAVNKNLEGKFILTFQNATYHVSKRQWNWATMPNSREKASFLKENFMPIQESGNLHLIENDEYLCENVYLKQFHGHTDGQIIPYITYKNRKIVYCADLIPTMAHIPIPYIMGYDTRPLITMDEKTEFLKDAVKNDNILFFEHDVYTECCTLQETPKGIRKKDVFSLKEFIESV